MSRKFIRISIIYFIITIQILVSPGYDIPELTAPQLHALELIDRRILSFPPVGTVPHLSSGVSTTSAQDHIFQGHVFGEPLHLPSFLLLQAQTTELLTKDFVKYHK